VCIDPVANKLFVCDALVIFLRNTLQLFVLAIQVLRKNGTHVLVHLVLGLNTELCWLVKLTRFHLMILGVDNLLCLHHKDHTDQK
jgi:hypothetical protein